MTNHSFIATADHASALAKIQKTFPGAFFNSTAIGGNQLITVKGEEVQDRKQFRKACANLKGRLYPYNA